MSFILGALCGMGVGSGGFYILYLTLLRDIPQSTAQGLNFAFFITASLGAAVINLYKKRISFYPLLFVLPTGLLGTLAGALLTKRLSPRALSVTFGISIVIVGVLGILKLFKKQN